MTPTPLILTLSFAAATSLGGQSRSVTDSVPRQTQSDDYTRYELMEPGSAKFRILYEVTATTSGARYFFNPIRKGSVASDERVWDRTNGKPLAFETVNGFTARSGGVRTADTTGQYIRVTLAHPVPADGGEARVMIDKTYYDPASYKVDSTGNIIFSRSLGIKRNAIVLPKGYEILSSNWPSQILQEADGRIALTFWNNTPAEAPVEIKARRLTSVGAVAVFPPALAGRLDDRAHQNREIVYFLRQPETHTFDLYHDYTESRPGVGTYLNVVRAGSSVAGPSAKLLDTGEELRWEVVKGDAIKKAGLDVADVTSQTEVVVFRFTPVKVGETARLRMNETYTDSVRYRVENGTLIWDRSFGRPTNAVVLPAGWRLTNSSIPASVSTLPDGRVRLDFINPRPDEIAVLITAVRR